MSIPTNDNIAASIKAGLPEATVTVDGDGHHFEALVICNAFEGKSRIQRHQMVYKALGGRMASEIHALSIKAMTVLEQQKLNT